MNKLKLQELNRKLVVWAGLRFYDPCIVFDGDQNCYEAPDFTNDFNACIKWLVPLLNDRGFGIYRLIQHSFHSFGVELGVLTYQGTIERYMDGIYAAVNREPALALCLAIIKLVEVK